MTDSARFRGSNAELCEFLERKNAELEVERDRYRAALTALLDAVERYTYGSLGEAEDAAREALDDD